MRLVFSFIVFAFLGLQAAATLPSAAVKEYYIPINADLKLRVVKVNSAGEGSSQGQKNVIVFLPGRASFFEKNTDFISIVTGHESYINQDEVSQRINPFKDQVNEIWVVEYRAHGKSGGRLGAQDQRCHINDFEDYLSDLHKVVTETIVPLYDTRTTKFFLMGTSMGGHIGMRYAQDYKHPFDQLILIAPMLGFKTDPWPKWVAKILVKSACLLGLNEKYAIGYGDLNLAQQTFNREKSHHNRKAFEETLMLLKENPQLITSGPTYGWVSAAFDSQTKLLEPSNLKKISIPVLMIAAGEDTQVENHVMQNVKTALPQCHFVTIKGAWHNLLKESDTYRIPFLQTLVSVFR
jgi:lysophospholipase